ncbi:hypothetical protein Kpol_1072p26 [Vanderwaltozyma polyspora DSM 70294]|uniref:Dihydrofolate reductase n=1 Tax=Vanderwaltozyma polyspora (strain ATCC 22028 / DSM 70294 / BCRC 21397 / CBS 2163 / NBRC 10782 / NRRL Y-8283 / UCD 57-17) TaxID=436907 RepID=A7TKP4_VANPO|nr:uncharacterized protein Kpol_1072p26 [Vanderwaltozyma polyspora DSM 70294]EDO17156.1 hypothetical protein Kpol_1072p26 [Vanderwaltozyma polyspora DSM 70294]
MSQLPVVSIVACLLPEFGIGLQGTLPWRLAKEMKFFRQVTSSTFDSGKQNAVIMGRKTWESIPAKFRPLPNRTNVVISRSFTADLVLSDDNSYLKCNSLYDSIEKLNSSYKDKIERVYIIGGGEIYKESLNLCDYWLITKIVPLETGSDDDVPPPKVDTFLDSKTLSENYIEDKNVDLGTFLPSQVELPDKESPCKNSSVPLKYAQQERGLEFGYSLWRKK